MISRKSKFALCAVLAACCLVLAEDRSEHIEPEVANRNLKARIEPTVPALAKAVGVGGTVVVDITIDATGKVGSVTLVSGHPMLAPALIEAARKWEYSPFLRGGKAASVITRVEWRFDSPKNSKAQEEAIQDYYPAFRGCYDLVKQGKGADAESKCKEKETLAISAQLPENRVLERSDADVFLGHALFLQHRYSESVPLYEKAVEIRKTYEGSDRDADFASENASLARAYAAIGNISQSDAYYSRAVTIFKAAIVNLPDMKDNYSARLKDIFLEYSKLKTAMGQSEDPSRLSKEASQL